MRGLLYLEYRYAAHQLRAIVRSPLRLGIWIPYVLAMAFLFVSRGAGSQRSGSGSFALSPAMATAVGGFYAGLFGISVAAVASGRITAFRTTAEAILISNAGIRPLTVALWLQGRKLVMSWTRWLGSLIYFFFLIMPQGLGVVGVARAMLAMLLLLAVQLCMELPVFLLVGRGLGAPLRVAGYALAAFGLAFAALGSIGHAVRRPVLAAIHVDPGRAVTAMLHGDATSIAVCAALLIAFFVATRLLGDDALPELYAAALHGPASRRMRPLATGERFSGNGGRIARIPSGALALVWKDWVGFKRSRGSTFRLAAGCTFWILCGVGAALTAIHFDDPSPLVTLGALTTALLAIATPTGALLGLTNDLGKPLFWLSPATLRARMAAWTFARAWRGGFTVGLAPLAAGLVLGNPGAAGVAFLLAFAANWSLQSLGVGLFALFPDPVDARGPMALLRLFVTVAYVVPAALVGAALYAATTSAAFAAAGAAAALAAEGWAVVELASMRFEEHGAALATLVRAT